MEPKNQPILQCRPVAIRVLKGGVQGTEALLTATVDQITVSAKGGCLIKGPASLLLDFGRELCGTVRVLTHTCPDSCSVRLRLGESYGEVNALLGEKGAGNDHAPRDVEINLTRYSDLRFCQSAFRFCRLDFPVGETHLMAIYAEDSRYVAPRQMTYRSEDALLQRIFETAADTVNLCVQNGVVWDGAKRDRLVWAGDLHSELLALTTLYGKVPPLERSLVLLWETRADNGHMNGMPQYSAWWLICMADYAVLGDAAFVAAHREEIRAMAQQVAAYATEGHPQQGEDCFFDWPTHETADEPEGCWALMLFCARKLRQLYLLLGENTTLPDTLIEKLKDRRFTIRSASQALAMKWMATGSLTEAETARLLKNGPRGLSTFMSYYILSAVAAVAGRETALDWCRTYYGAMLERGATTFFENFSLDWLENSGRIDEPTPVNLRDLHGDFGDFCYKGYRHSLCHGWSAGVIRFLWEQENGNLTIDGKKAGR